MRDSLERLQQLPFVTEKGATVLLQDVARISLAEGPPMVRSENARLSGWVYVDVRGRDLRSVVRDMQAAVGKQVAMPAGYAVSWSGQFEYLERATERLKLVVPVTLAIIFVLLYLLFRSPFRRRPRAAQSLSAAVHGGRRGCGHGLPWPPEGVDR